jgi:hypothetical protein
VRLLGIAAMLWIASRSLGWWIITVLVAGAIADLVRRLCERVTATLAWLTHPRDADTHSQGNV